MREFNFDTQQLIESNEQKRGEIFAVLGRRYLELTGRSVEEVGNIMYRAKYDINFFKAEYVDPDGNVGGMSTMDAFRCLIDTHRTSVLIDGVKGAVDSIKRSGKEKVVAIDAGTGTGILSIGLIAAGCDKVYALEINPDTARTTKAFLEELGLSDRIIVVLCDATSANISELTEDPADILVSENLSAGLFDEPQYDIIKHLSNFLSPTAKIVPYMATNLFSLGSSEWKDQPDPITAFTRLPDLSRSTGNIPFIEVISSINMDIPVIASSTKVNIGLMEKDINTLLISTRFKINDSPDSPVLQEDSAEFLGGSYAVRLPQPLIAENGIAVVELSYLAGKRITSTHVEVHGNKVSLK